MNLLKELRKTCPRYGFSLQCGEIIVSFRGGHKYSMTLEESERFLAEMKDSKQKSR